jgi:ankyrin repeat protein
MQTISHRQALYPSDVLEHLLIAKADQTFLWIKLVLPLLEDRRILLLSDVDTIAAMLPSDLASLYRHLLLSIPEADQPVAARMLRLLVASDRPLTGGEIGIMMTIGPDHKSMASLATDQLLFNKDSVRAALGPLVRLHRSIIELVHQSLKEHITSLSNGVQDALAITFGIDLIRDELQIFATCSLYLSLEDFQQNIQALVSFRDDSPTTSEAIISSPHSSTYGFDLYEKPMFKEDPLVDEAAWATITTQYKLFDYATLHWATDFSVCNAAATEQHHSAARALCKANTAQFENWYNYFRFRTMYPEPFPFTVNALMVALYFGHIDTLLRLLSDPESQDPGSLAQALYWAARQGRSGCVGVLLQQPQCDPQISELKSQVPMSAAAQFGHLECVTLLLKDVRLDINAQDSHGRTVLSLTASNNHAEIASVLLAHNNIDVNLPNNSLNTPLHWAVAAGSYSIVPQILTDSRAHSGNLDKRGRNVLSWAAEYGATDIVSLLLHSRVVSADQKDSRGRTPLSYASQHGHLPS